MSCADTRLDEYLDGELAGDDRQAVETHLAACSGCRKELDELRRLEQVLLSRPPGSVPEPERFVRGVRARSRRSVGRWQAAVAAVLMIGLVGLLVWPNSSVDVRAELAAYAIEPSDEIEKKIRQAGPEGLEVLQQALDQEDPRTQFAAAVLMFRLGDADARRQVLARLKGSVDVRAELERYARQPSSETEERIRSAGRMGFVVLEEALGDEDARVQFAAASLLFKLADQETRSWVLAHFQSGKSNGSWVLTDPGTDDSDVEMVSVAVSAFEMEGQREWAVDVLRKLQVLNLEARKQVIGSVVTLLKHTDPEIQKHALDIVEQLGIEFPLSAIVDLLDSPELGDQALKVLREATGRDFGRDKKAWKKAIESKEVKP